MMKNRKNIILVIKSMVFSFKIIFDISKNYVIISFFNIIYSAVFTPLNILLKGFLISALTSLAIDPTKETLKYAVFLGLLMSFPSLFNILYTHYIIGLKIKYYTIIETGISSKYNKILVENVNMQDYENVDFKYNKNYINDISENILNIYNKSLDLIENIIGFVLVIIILIGIEWWLVIPVLLSLFLSSKLKKIFAEKEKKLRHELLPKSAIISHTNDVLTTKDYIEELKMFDVREFFINIWHKNSIDENDATHKLNLKVMPYKILTYIINILGTIIVLIVAVGKIIARKVTNVAELTIAYDTSNSILSYVSSISSLYSEIYGNHWTIQIARDSIKEIEEIRKSDLIDYTGSFNTIVFDKVSFSYKNDDTYVLKDVSFTLKEEEYIAIVGKNGAGKTTLCMLLCGLYRPTRGTIYYDGVPHEKLRPQTIYKKFTMMFQEFFKYSMSISENITFKEMNDIERDRFTTAVQKSNTEAFISRLPEGYDTELIPDIIEGATNLSIGQWQRISAARTLYKKADAIIFDEPASALDANAESEIYEAILEYGECNLKIVITHQLSSIKKAKRILVLDEGILTADSNFNELIEYDNVFSRMYKMKAKRYDVSPVEEQQVNNNGS